MAFSLDECEIRLNANKFPLPAFGPSFQEMEKQNPLKLVYTN